MSGSLIIIVFVIAAVLAVGLLIFLGILIAGFVKHDKKLVKLSFIPLGSIILLEGLIIILFVCAEGRIKDNFDNREMVTVDNKSDERTITILNSGSESMGSFTGYYFLNENVLEKIEDVEVQFNNLKKYGYKFSAVNEGQTVIAILENDCARWTCVDFYTVSVDENLEITLIKTEKFDIGEGETLEDVVPQEYSFFLEQFAG